MVSHAIVDQGVNISDSIQTGRGVVIQAPTAQAHAVALQAEVQTSVTVDLKVIRGSQGRAIRLGLDQRAMWVGFAVVLGDLYDQLTAHGLPPLDSIFLVTAVAGFCLRNVPSK